MTAPFESQRDNTILIIGDHGLTDKQSMLRTDLIDCISDELNLKATTAKNAFNYIGSSKQKSIGCTPIVETVPGTKPAEYRFTEYGFEEYTDLVKKATRMTAPDPTEQSRFRDWIDLYWGGRLGRPDLVSDYYAALDQGKSFVEVDYDILDFLQWKEDYQAIDIFEHYDEMVAHLRENLVDYLGNVIAEDNAKELLDRLEVRIAGISSEMAQNVEAIHDKDFDNFVAIKGSILEMSSVDKVVKNAAFKCMRCEHYNWEPQQPFGAIVEPTECENEHCGKKGPYKLDSDQSEWANRQLIIIASNTQINGTSRIKCFVEGDLCSGDYSVLGKSVIVTGKLTEMQKLDKTSKKKSVIFEHVLVVNNIIPADDSMTAFPTEEECKMFDEMAAEKNAYGLSVMHDWIMQNTAPQIHGREFEKTVATVPLFADWTWDMRDAGSNRSSVHVLLLGDPGTGKSEIGKDVLRISPKGFGPDTYKAGQLSSGAGLTSVAEKSELDGRWMLKAGFLAHADQSTVMLDEIDKIKKEQLEMIAPILEDQKQDVGKAGMGEFQSRVSVLMTGNPTGGNKIDPSIPLIDQFKCAEYVIQRIDLILGMPEIHDAKWSEDIANKIADSFTSPIQKPRGDRQSDPYASERTAPLEMLRKYVLYARSKPMPAMSSAARDVMVNHFINIKANYGAEANISGRALKSTLRVATAIARRELADTVSYAHAQEAIKIMETALMSVQGPSNNGFVQYDIIESGHSKTQQKAIEIITTLIQEGYKEQDLFEVCLNEGLERDTVKGYILKLKRQGDVYEPEPGVYRLTL